MPERDDTPKIKSGPLRGFTHRYCVGHARRYVQAILDDADDAGVREHCEDMVTQLDGLGREIEAADW